MMVYASLWDDSEEGSISITHLKEKSTIYLQITNQYTRNFQLTYHMFLKNSKMRLQINFLSTGMVYHRPNRIAPSMKHEELFDDVLFQRGIALDSISCVSGIGFYLKQRGTKNTDKVKQMFGLEQADLKTVWHMTLSAAYWKSNLSFEQNTEYLRLKAPFFEGTG